MISIYNSFDLKMSLLQFLLILPVRVFTAVWTSLFHSWFKLRWTPSSKSWLMRLDQKIRANITHKNHGEWVQVSWDSQLLDIWTVVVEGDHRDTTPLVFLHGMGGGANMFLNNIDALAEERDVILLDLPGFGLSCRPQLRVKYTEFWWKETTVDDIEEFYTEVLEAWLRKMKLDKIIMIGHSYGGYLSSVYCLKYPDRVKHLILADPWGFPHRPATADRRPFMQSKHLYVLSKLYAKMNVFTPIRALGPLGPTVFKKLRGDLGRKFGPHNLNATVQNYLYACNTCDSPSGEVGFSRVSQPFGWAKKPLLDRVANWDPKLDVTFIYGARSWVDSVSGYETRNQRHGNYVDVHVISGAGHHVYADRPQAFNNMVQMIADAVDNGVRPNISHESEERHLAMLSLRRRASCASQAELCNDEAGIHQERALSEHELEEQQEGYVDNESDEEVGKVSFSLGPQWDEDEELAARVRDTAPLNVTSTVPGRERKPSLKLSKQPGGPVKNVKFSPDAVGGEDVKSSVAENSEADVDVKVDDDGYIVGSETQENKEA